MDVVTTLFDGETGLDGAGRPGGDDLEHSGTSQDDGRRLSLTKGISGFHRSAWSPTPDC